MGSRKPSLFFVELGAAIRVASTTVPTLSSRPRSTSTVVDGGQDRASQFVFPQPVAKAQEGALIGQAGELLELGEFPIQRRIEESFFHDRIAQREPQLQEVNAQHGFQRKGRATRAVLGVVRSNEFDQCRPGNDPVHLIEEDLLTRLFGC